MTLPTAPWLLVVVLGHSLVETFLVQQDGIGVATDELVCIHPFDGATAHSLLLAADEDEFEVPLASLLGRLLGRSEFLFGLGHLALMIVPIAHGGQAIPLGS